MVKPVALFDFQNVKLQNELEWNGSRDCTVTVQPKAKTINFDLQNEITMESKNFA